MSPVRLRRLGRTLLGHGLLGVLTIVFLMPWAWVLSSSLKSMSQIFSPTAPWIPSPLQWSNYWRAVTYIPYFLYLKNTLIICFFVVIGTVISSAIPAYAFARVRWPGRDVVFVLVLATMMLPFQVTMIPLYIIFSRLGWVNTFLPLIVPAFFGNAFFIFLYRQFFLTIPMELSDAPRIDGASHYRIFAQIILPLSKPAMATCALFTFLWTYTDFLGPLIYLTEPSTWTLSLGLTGFVGIHSAEWGLLMAASLLFTLPVMALFFFMQKTFIQGIATTGFK